MEAHCSRVRCDQSAVASLVIDTRRAEAWLESYDERSTAIPLCATHADRIRPPTGWDLEDRREPQVVDTANVVQLPVEHAPAEPEPAPERKSDPAPAVVAVVDESISGDEASNTREAPNAQKAPNAQEDRPAGKSEAEGPVEADEEVPPLRLRLFPEEDGDPDSLDTDGDTPMLSRAFRIAARPDGA